MSKQSVDPRNNVGLLHPDIPLSHERKSRDDVHYSRTVLFVSFSRRGVARITVLAFLPPIPVDLFSCHQLGVTAQDQGNLVEAKIGGKKNDT